MNQNAAWIMGIAADTKEREKSEAKLREAIKILEGATSAIAGGWRDFWRVIF